MDEKSKQERAISTNSGIYQIQSALYPDRIYIGSAINLRNRKYHHLYSLRKNNHENPRLQNHFNKYGQGDLVFSVLLECSKDTLIQNEQHYLDLYKPCLNICLIAGSSLGRTQSDECKKKVSAANKGRKHTEESIRHMGEAQRGRVFPKEHRQKISMALRGKPKSKKARENMRMAALGRTMSEESSRKKSLATRGRPHSDGHNQKVSIAIAMWWRKRREGVSNGEK